MIILNSSSFIWIMIIFNPSNFIWIIHYMDSFNKIQRMKNGMIHLNIISDVLLPDIS